MLQKFQILTLTILYLICAVLIISAQTANRSFGKLVFADEFNQPANAPVDSSKWTAEIGGGGWGNQELEYYTNNLENARHDGDGALVITAIKKDLPLDFKCWYGQCRYTSARLITKGKFEQKYGRFEARIKIPAGQGMWAAFWMLGNDIDKVGWSQCGEIDVMENIGREPFTVHGTIHGPGYSGDKGIGAPFQSLDGSKFADGFHVYATEWTKNKIEFYVDDKLYKRITPKDLPAGKKWVYEHPFFVILNLAIGGNWGGDPVATTAFPGEMKIDYVRVYAR